MVSSDVLSKPGQWRQAVNLLDMLWDYSIIPNEENFMPAIRACENAGMFEMGDKLFWQMREQTKLVKASWHGDTE